MAQRTRWVLIGFGCSTILSLFLFKIFWNRVEFSAESKESECDFVSSRGIMKICDVFPKTPESSTTEVYSFAWENLRPGDVIYIQGSAVPDFIKKALPRITSEFTLVTGDCDESMPTQIFGDPEFEEFVEDYRLLHWFSQNLVRDHHKMSRIPIGLDYHTMVQDGHPVWGPRMHPLQQEKMLKDIVALAPPLHRRALICYANFQFLTTTKLAGDRRTAMLEIPRSLMYYEPQKLSRHDTWKAQSLMAFVVSPHGGGYDCHRTWEALALGCIAIVKTSPIDSLFDGLPVLIVDKWSDITEDLLRATVDEYARRRWDLSRLTLAYWAQHIRNVTKSSLAGI
jgi:hypothetical protein